MSSEALTYVFHQSPYTGVKRCIHLAIADVVGINRLFFMRHDALAARAGCVRQTVVTFLKEMESDGYIRHVDTRRNRLMVYQFLMPGVVADDDNPPEQLSPTVTTDVVNDDNPLGESILELTPVGDNESVDPEDLAPVETPQQFTQRMVAYYVDCYRHTHNGANPSEFWRSLCGKTIKRHVDLGEDVLKAAIRAIARENKSPAALPHLAAEYQQLTEGQ